MTNKILSYILIAILSISATAFAVKFIDAPTPTMSMDIPKIVNDFARKTSELGMSELQQKKLSRDFSEALTRISADYATQHHALLLVSASVVSGSIDVTEELEQKVFQAIGLMPVPIS